MHLNCLHFILSHKYHPFLQAKVMSTFFIPKSKKAVFSISLLGIYYLYKIIYNKIKKYPSSPLGLPLFGNILSLLNQSKLQTIIAPSYGKIALFNVVGIPIIFLNNVESIKKVLIKKNMVNRPNMGRNQSLVMLNGKRWIERRKFIHDSLFSLTNAGYIDNLFDKMLSDAIIPTLDDCSNNDVMWYPRKLLFHLSFNVIYTPMFGKPISFSDPTFNEYRDLTDKIVSYSAVTTPAGAIPVLKYIPYFKRILNEVSIMQDRIGCITKEWMNKLLGYDDRVWNKDINKNPYWHKINQKETQQINQFYIDKILYGYLTTANMTQKQIMDDLLLLFVAGADTTSNTTEYGFTYLAKYPPLQELLYNELRTVFKDETNIKLRNHINKLPLLRAFIRETLRLGSAASIAFPRYIDHDLTVHLKDQSYVLPKKSIIIPNLFYANKYDPCWTKCKDSNIVNNPNYGEINLDAWLTKDKSGNISFKHNPNFVALSYGKRNCVGYRLALRELQCLFAHLILKYQFKLKNDVEIKQTWTTVLRIDPQIGILVNKR